MNRRKLLSINFVLVLLLSGCSVKPKVIEQEYVEEDVKKTIEYLSKIDYPITKPITLDEAIQRAVIYNLDKKVDILNSAIAEQKIDIVAYESLPSLTAKAGYTERNNYAASSSVPFLNGQPGNKTDSYSISQDKESFNTGIGFSWNILDFGLSYVRANQQANRYLIAKERERKSIHNIKQEVRNAYYQAVSADELLKRLKPLLLETKKAFEDSKNIKNLNLDTPMKSLTYQRELLEVIRSLNTLEENLIKSKTELSKLMGIKPGVEFELAEKIQDKYDLPKIDLNVQELEKIALENRPELQESRYQEKITQDEIKAAMLQMLPGINLNAGYSFDNSNYLLNNDWINYGASVSWNLLSVFNGKMNRDLAKTQMELAKQQKVALSMAIISQIHISMIEYHQAVKDYKLSEDYYQVAKEIFKIIENENALDITGNLSLIKEKLNYLISNLRLSSSYSKVQNSYGKILSSIGKEEVFKADIKLLVEDKVEKNQLIENKKEIKDEKNQIVESSKNEFLEAYSILDLNLRDKPTLKSNIVGRVYAGEKVLIIKEENRNADWYKTPNGYIWEKYLRFEKE